MFAVVEELGLTEVRAAGHSMGGAALAMAEQRRPGELAGVVGVDVLLDADSRIACVDVHHGLGSKSLRKQP